jgi:CHASE2 domain-containing sensor protein/class 3 adenylate cyclase
MNDFDNARRERESHSSRIVALLFTDMVGSVELQSEFGALAYARLLGTHNELFDRAAKLVGGGRLLDKAGDGQLWEFANATDAVEVALLFQTLLREEKWEIKSPRVRIGIHQGQMADVVREDGSENDFIGMPKNIGSRIMSAALPSQILMTRPVYDDARQFVRENPIFKIPGRKGPALRWKAHGQYMFKGAEGIFEIYEVGVPGIAPLRPPPASDKVRPVPVPPETARQRMPRTAGVITAILGLLLLTPIGDPWINASYDYLWRFGSHEVTNNLAVVLMDKDSHETLHQDRANLWDRSLHASLLERLAQDKCPLVVMDIFFENFETNASDLALSNAMSKCSNVVLMADQRGLNYSKREGVQALPPAEPLLMAARDHWGTGYFGTNDQVVRKHWPFPSPGAHPSLSWTAAKLAGAKLSDIPAQRWLRYYGESGPGAQISYAEVSNNPANFFQDKIVFIGNQPETRAWDKDIEDKYKTPYTRWSGATVGGVELHATAFLNLLNGDWLGRLHWALEAGIVLILGAVIGYVFSRIPFLGALASSVVIFVCSLIAAVLLNHFSNIWFPWLVFAGGQIPGALLMAVLPLSYAKTKTLPDIPPEEAETQTITSLPTERETSDVPEVPEYDLFTPHFGEGGFGKVWLAKNAVGQWQAVKAVYLSKFDNNPRPYESEFNALIKYKPVSEKHPGLLRIELISRKKETGYFYYVMELGDSQDPRWQENPILYKPRDLESVRRNAPGGRLSSTQVLQYGAALCEALHFLHLSGLTHRDIKPSNIIFVKGSPKLADIGLVTEARPQDLIRTWAGTAAFAPPAPEKPGTVQADIYALGMVLYVISTGREPDTFSPEISAPFIDTSEMPEFLKLRALILKACAPDPKLRFHNASEMKDALMQSLCSPAAAPPT